MPRTINEGFRDFLTSLTPSDVETIAAKSHRNSIKECLSTNFTLTHFFRSGSFGNGTSIRGYSDTDYFAVIDPHDLDNDSTSSLITIRDILAKRFSTTTVQRNCPAISLDFDNGAERTEITPAFFIRTEKPNRTTSIDVYGMPNCNNSKWMESIPDAHTEYVRKIDYQYDNKVKPLIRFIKAWKFYNDVPIRSFYLEMRIAKFALDQEYIEYEIDILCALRYLRNSALAPMHDPLEISHMIGANSTENNRLISISKLNTAISYAEKSIEAKKNGDIKEAFEQWNYLFYGNFPSYYR